MDRKTSIIVRGLAVLLALPLHGHAEGADAETRMRELEQQLKVLSQELAAMQQQMANSKEDRVKEKGKSQGQPVYAAFKDGITFEDGSGKWKMAINGRVQADARYFSPDETAADTFSLRRARLGGTLTLFKDFVVRVEGEYSGSNTQLTYGYIDINKLAAAKVRVGQFKPFYGLERAMSTNFTDFQERSLADSVLGGTYDRGLMVHGTPINGIYYSAAYINGNNADETDVRYDNKDATARVTANLAQFAEWKDSVVHLGGFAAKGKQEAGSNVPSLRTEARGYSFFETAAATRNTFSETVDRTRSGVELALAKGPVKFQSEYIRADFDGRSFDRDMAAWYASVNWLVTGETFASTYKDGAFGRLSPKKNFQFDGDGWGAVQLGIRYSSFDADDFVLLNPAGTGRLAANKVNQANAWTLGANWILNPNLRVNANYVHTKLDKSVTNGGARFDEEDALTMRAQFDF
jgi:phosphate-selective porin OprO/OprP